MGIPASGKHSLSIIVPYRDRLVHLQEFVPHVQRHLKGVSFRILVVEQRDSKPFNRGKLLNIGFSCEEKRCDYVCFHDVDMLPLDDCDYSMPDSTTHLAGRVEMCGFKMPYPEYLGGVLLVLKNDFVGIDGFSNLYWGWGEEDDDLWLRFQVFGVQVLHRAGRFKSLPHQRSLRPVDNLLLLEKNLLRARAAVCDPSTKRAVEKRLWSVWEELSSEYPRSTVITRRRAMCAGSSELDGLSTLDYEPVRRVPVGELLPNVEMAAEHEILSVRL